MKTYFFLFFLFFLGNLFGQIYYGADANRIIEGAIKVYHPFDKSFPSYVLFNSSSQLTAEQLLIKWKRNYHIEAALLNVETDQLGIIHKTYQQTVNNIPVEFAIFRLHLKNGLVESYSGNIYKEIKLNDDVGITFQSALEKAMSVHNAQRYAWEDEKQEEILKTLYKKDTSYFPKDKKVIYKVENGYELVYKITLYSLLPLKNKTYYISAKDGRLIDVLENIHTTDVPGTAVTRYSGTQTITTDYYNTNYRLRESGRGNGIITLNMQNGSNISAAVDFTDDDNYWNNVNPQQDEIATDVHWATEKYYDYLYNTFGRNSLNNNGYAIYSYLHPDFWGLGYAVNNANALWNGNSFFYGDGGTVVQYGSGTIYVFTPFTTVDIVGHELTHGLTSFTAQLIYSGESGMLNEAFSDIFGTVLEYYAKPLQANWQIGEQVGHVMRSLENPKQYGNPDTYEGEFWEPTPIALHKNSTVISHWFFLVSQGGTGINDNGNSYQVNGIGIDNAAKIAYRMLVYYLTPNANFLDARFYAIIAAVDLFGGCSPQVEAVTNAMYAVGIGQAYVPEVIADFDADLTPNCQDIYPKTVQFNNYSINAWHYYWNFGDGSSSNIPSPSHNYNNIGTFNVSLIVDGGACGLDTMTKNIFVYTPPIDSCEAYMTLWGHYEPYISCKGIIYGGIPNQPYSNNISSCITIKPFNGNRVKLDFLSFDVGSLPNDTNCNNAYIMIYDGPDCLTSPIIGKYCVETGIPPTIVSSTNTLSIYMYANNNIGLNEGFMATWTCEFDPPQANFSVTPLSQCSRTYAFNDLSLNYPRTWLWDFGDGQTSTLKNPIHEYQNNGTYSVKLIVSSEAGIDTLINNNLITIQGIEAPQVEVVNDTVCLNQTATIIANSTEETYWYLSQNDSTPIFIGDTLITMPLTNPVNTFWVQNVIEKKHYVGDTRSSYDGSYIIFPYQTFLNFNSYTPCKLVSVLVNSLKSQYNVEIKLTNINNNTLQSKIIPVIPWGISRINLDFDLPVAYNLKLVAPEYVFLWANPHGASYPYTINNILSITSNNALPNGYIYFYNWEIRLPEECLSPKVPVEVYAVNCTKMDDTEQHNINIYPIPANDILNLDLPADFKITSIKCYDLIGKIYNVTLFINDGKISINTQKLPDGVYFLQLSNNTKSILTKIVVLHK